MNDITIMESPKFGQVRKVLVDGEWMYVALDVAKALGYAKERNAIATHCRYALKRGVPHPQNPDVVQVDCAIPTAADFAKVLRVLHVKVLWLWRRKRGKITDFIHFQNHADIGPCPILIHGNLAVISAQKIDVILCNMIKPHKAPL